MVDHKLYKQLLDSDEGLFHKLILPLIPIEIVKKLYSDKTDVRPAAYAINHVAAALFVRLTGLTEEKFLEQLPWNIKYQHAIGIVQWDDNIPFGEKTFSNLRKRIKDYNDSHPGEDIWDELTHAIDIQIAQNMQLTEKNYNSDYKYGLRIDTLMISMYAAKRHRLDLVYTTMALCVSDLVSKGVILPPELQHFTNTDDHRSVAYFKGLQDEYIKEGLPIPNENEEQLTTAKRKHAIAEHRLLKLVGELEPLRNLCTNSDLSESENFRLLERLISEQTECKDGVLVLRDKRIFPQTVCNLPLNQRLHIDTRQELDTMDMPVSLWICLIPMEMA